MTSLDFNFTAGELLSAFRQNGRPIETAVAKTMKTLASDIKAEARANIKGAGLGTKMANALRVDLYPRDGESIGAALAVYSNVSYSGAFEEGADLQAKGQYMWVPFSNTPKKLGKGGFNFRTYKAKFGTGSLSYINTPGGKPPLLALRVKTKRGGVSTKRVTQGMLGKKPEEGANTIVPVFFGIKSAKIDKRTDVTGVVEKNVARFASLYFSNLNPDQE